jgi:hypothetical protein
MARTPPAACRHHKARLSVVLPRALINQVRNAAYWLPQGSVSRVVQLALECSITHLEATQGHPFPTRPAELRRGRRGLGPPPPPVV